MKSSGNICFLALIALVGLLGLGTAAQAQKSYADKIGVDLDGIGDGNRAKPFVDLGKTFRGWVEVGGTKRIAELDEHGWPKSDATTVLFDVRPFGTWKPPVDDPDKYQPDWSGTYKMSFQGQAVMKFVEETRPQVVSQKYDPATNITTADLVVPQGVGLCRVAFTQTKRTADSPAGSGFTNLHVIRPGYGADKPPLFTDEFVHSLKPFAVLRFMDWLDTNHNPGFYGDAGHHVLNWSDRHVPDDATQAVYGNKYGVAWEYVAELAKATGKDVWINIPVAATDDYVKNLAKLLKTQLPPKCNVYIEHSNEVWNFSFPQYVYNKLAAADEVKNGHSVLNNDGSDDKEVWTHRRHAKRLIEIGNTFRETFGPDGASHIRPIYASWVISVKPHYKDVFAWVQKTYGPPKNYFYGLAGAAYYNIDKAPKDADVPTLIKFMRQSSDSMVKQRGELQQLADQYGIKNCQYEIGPDVGGGKPDNIANRILANRDPAMKDLVLHDAIDNWFAHGGDLYMYFAHCGPYSRHGCWGLSEDITNLNTPKWQAIYQLTRTARPQ